MKRAAATAALLAAVWPAAPAAQPQARPAPSSQSPAAGTPDLVLIRRFVAAVDGERRTLLAAHPELVSPPYRSEFSRLAAEQRNSSDLDGATATLTAALFIGVEQKLPATEAAALLGLAAVEGTRSDYVAARRYAERGLAVATAANLTPLRQQALSNLSIVMRRTGDVDGALATAEESLALARTVGDPMALGRVLNNLGIAANEAGQGRRAIEAYTESLALKTQNGAPPLDIANTLSNIGGLYAELGDTALAIEYYRRALAEVEHTTLDDAITTVYSNLGQAYSTLGQNDVARGYLEKALAIGERIKDPRRTATALYLLGSILRDEGRLDDAEAMQMRALEMRESAGLRLSVIESLSELADIHLQRGLAAEGLPFAERAVALAAESGLRNQLWKAQFEAGLLLTAVGRTADARRAFEQSIQTIESLRQMTTGGTRTQQQYFADRSQPYYALAALDATAGRSLDALVTVDRARARALTDIIATGRLSADRLSPEERDEDRRLTQAMQTAASALADAAGNPDSTRETLSALGERLTRERLAREAFIGQLYGRHPDLRFARGNVPELSAGDLASLVPAGTAIATFALDGDQSWTYVVTHGTAGAVVTAHRLPLTPPEITALADRFATQVATRDLAFARTSRALYDALFAPVDARLAGVSRLVVIPDGSLWKVPFQALRTPRGRFVIEERAVAYSPSIAALSALEQRRRGRPAPGTFLVALGDPDVSSTTTEGQRQRGAAASRLPEAAREVRAIGRLYGEARSKVFVDRDASEVALRDDVGRASVLHVATHGILDNANPMYSHLLLAPGSGAATDHTRDGRLEAWEVLDLGLTADLAVLSACETARGGTGYGEGMIGLSWSLFASGVSTAVVSQWEVDSASTTSLMIAFHRRLLAQRGRPDAPDALRRAALTLLAQPQYRHPFYWAGFISVGTQ